MKFFSRGPGYQLYLTRQEALIKLEGARREGAESAGRSLALKLIGSNSDSKIEGLDPLPGKSNYFIGNDPSEWRTDVPNYSRVRYREVYSGIDLVYYGDRRQFEYDLVVAPHADPRQINLALEGATQIKTSEDGELLVSIGEEELRMRKPFVYQDVDGERREVTGNYSINERGRVCFAIGAYDPNYQLVIDPVVDYSTYFGGSGTDVGYGIAVDQNGNVYVTGQTSSPNFPLQNPFSSTMGGIGDAFVIKLSSGGTSLVFATYIGGRNFGERGWAIAVDKAGNVYFTGETNSLNFPTVKPAQGGFRGNGDAFVAKLNIQGNTLLYSTYLGGSFFDASYGIALDRFDNAYITGRTDSANFPVKGAIQAQRRGLHDAFVTRLNADGAIVYSTYLGGNAPMDGESDNEAGYGITLDKLLNVYVTGYTSSPTFPTVNAAQPNFGGVEDAFITKINPSGSAIVNSTFLGGNSVDNARSIAVDSYGAAYVTGFTISADFPQVNPLQPGYGGNIDGFVTKLSAAGTSFVYSTYFGGNGAENTGLASDNIPSCAIAVDNFGHAYLTGMTESPNLPVINAIQPMLRGNTDAFVAKLDAAGTGLIYSTYLGSSFTSEDNLDFLERGTNLAVDSFNNVYVIGQVLGNDFPTVFPFQRNYGGGSSDLFITKISTPDLMTILPVSAASFSGAAFSPESIVSVFGSNLASGFEIPAGFPLPTTLRGTSVTVKDSNGVDHFAPIFFVAPTQINFQVPAATAPGKATITVSNETANLSTTIWISSVSPGLFAANSNGEGVPAAFVLRMKGDGTMSFEAIAEANDLGVFFPSPIDLGPESDRLFLILFGTGLRNRSSLSNIKAQIGGVDVPVLYAGLQGDFVGEDQINLPIPRSLAGRGEVALTLVVDGMNANPVSINVR